MDSPNRTIAKHCFALFLFASLASCSPFFYYSIEGKKNRELRLSLFRREVLNIGLQEEDTLVDIGSGYGEVNINLAIAQPGIHQILVDTNSRLLNEKNISKLKKKIERKAHRHYLFSHEIIINQPDTIPLPTRSFKKVLYRKTLHELNDVGKMMAETRRILRKDGELVIIEANPLKPGEIDVGCKKKHLSFEEIEKMVSSTGFVLSERLKERINEKIDSLYFNVVKFRKSTP